MTVSLSWLKTAPIVFGCLVLLFGVPAFALGLSAAGDGVSPITVQTTMHITPSPQSVGDSIVLAALHGTTPDTGDVLTLEWRKDSSPWGFVTWSLYLSSALGESQAVHRAQRELKRVSPEDGHVYVTTLSYDPLTGKAAISVVDETAATSVHAMEAVLEPYTGTLLPKHVPGMSVTTTASFVPAGIQWKVMSGPNEDALLTSTRLSKQEMAAFVLTAPSSWSGGTVRLVAEGEGRRLVLATTEAISQGESRLQLQRDSLPVGTWKVWLELVEGQQTWPLGAVRNVTVVEGVVTASVRSVERRGGTVRGIIRASSDGLLSDVHIQLFADVTRLVDGAWELIEQNALLFETVVDIPAQPIDIAFSLDRRIGSDWGHNVDLTVKSAEGKRIVMDTQEERHFLPVGDSGMMGGIPQVDIAGDTSRLTVVDHVPDAYIGHPDTVLMDDGYTILVVYPLEHGGPTAFRRSTDGGKTWSERLPVPTSWSQTADVPTIFRLVDPEGTERVFVYQNMVKPGLEPRPVNRQDTFDHAVSLDGGVTWSEFEPTGLRGHVSPNTIVPIAGGRYVTVFQLHGHIHMATTDDGGQTWRGQRTIASHPSAALTEPAAVLSPDGQEIAVLIRENSRKYNSMLIMSNDNGQTWSAPVELPPTLTGDRHMPRYAPDGRLVITFRDMAEGSPTYGDFVAWIGTYDDLVNLRPGQYRVRLLENRRNPWDTGYAGLELLPDGTFVSTTYVPLAYGAKPSVVSLRFTMQELDSLLADTFGL